MFSLSRFFVGLLVLIINVEAQADDHCAFNISGYKFNLKPLWRSNAQFDYDGHDDKYVYHMNVCGKSYMRGQCAAKNGTLCQYRNDTSRGFVAMIASTDEVPTWELIDPNSPAKGVRATYAKVGDNCTLAGGVSSPRKAIMSFYCVDQSFPTTTFTIHEDPSSPCVYQLSLTTSEACPRVDLPFPPLNPGQTYPRHVSNKSWFYDTIVVGAGAAELSVRLVQTGANASLFGDPDIYIRKDTLPTLDSYDVRAVSSYVDEMVSIRKTKDKPLQVGTYVIGVYAFGDRPVSYDLQAFTFNCSGNCSFHGDCVDGACQCAEGYNIEINDDCSAKVQEVTLGQFVNGDFSTYDTVTYLRFVVNNDTNIFQLQVDVDWNNTNVTATLLIAKDRYPTAMDYDGRAVNFYGQQNHLTVSLNQDVGQGEFIAALMKNDRDAKTVTPFSFVAHVYDCPAGCSGHGTCDKISHNCTCDDGFMSKSSSGFSDCSMEHKSITEQASVQTSVASYESVYFSIDVDASKTAVGMNNELVVAIVCKDNASYPTSYLSFGKMPSAYDHDYASPLPAKAHSEIIISSYDLKTGRYMLMVPNNKRDKIVVSVSIKYRSMNCNAPSPSPESESTGHSTGTVAGFSFLFLLIGLACGCVIQTKRGGANKRHRMIDDGINADGSYDPPMIENENF